MTNERPGPPESVPTLTEEVSLPPAAREAAVEPDGPPGASESASVTDVVLVPDTSTGSAAPAAPPPSADQLTRQILADLQRQIDLVLEFRVREVLTPILTRATDALVREARSELTRTLHDVVARSVAEELLRQRQR